jgi:anti-sigma factor RsiW
MAGPMDTADETGLWHRWRAAVAHSAATVEPDALTLAAYAEDRLAPGAAAEVEDWLAANPQAAHDILAARQLREDALPAAPEAIVARAQALAGGEAQVLAFRPRPRVPLRGGALGWGAVAASILVASLAGFATGNDTYVTLAGSSPPSLSQEVLDPPTGLFNGIDEDSSI